MQTDLISTWLDTVRVENNERLVSQKWLRSDPAKRFIYYQLYGDLLNEITTPRRILDVGGGLTGLTKLIAMKHDYILVDLMAHESQKTISDFELSVGKDFIRVLDWYYWDADETFDIAIANDIFPNVDQRLDLFVERILPKCTELRMSLTYYNNPRFYITKRIDGDEIMCMLSYTGAMTRTILEKYENRIIDIDLSILETNANSLWENGRQVCLVSFKGDKKA